MRSLHKWGKVLGPLAGVAGYLIEHEAHLREMIPSEIAAPLYAVAGVILWISRSPVRSEPEPPAQP